MGIVVPPLLAVIAWLLYSIRREVRLLRILVELPRIVREDYEEAFEKALKARREEVPGADVDCLNVFLHRRNYFKSNKVE